MTLQPCLEPFCGRVAAPKGRGRCEVHATERNRETHRTGRIDPKGGRIYGTAKWQHTRRRILYGQGETLCRLCKAEGVDTIATEVDHVTPLEQGGELWALDNLQPICKRHHGEKTNREMRGTHERSTR